MSTQSQRRADKIGRFTRAGNDQRGPQPRPQQPGAKYTRNCCGFYAWDRADSVRKHLSPWNPELLTAPWPSDILVKISTYRSPRKFLLAPHVEPKTFHSHNPWFCLRRMRFLPLRPRAPALRTALGSSSPEYFRAEVLSLPYRHARRGEPRPLRSVALVIPRALSESFE